MEQHTIPDQTLILLVGPPAVGKTTIAKLLVNKLKGIKHFDIDDIRKTLFGTPVPNDGTDPEIKRRDDNEMAGTYKGLWGFVEAFLRAEHPLLPTFTLSNRDTGQAVVRSIIEHYPKARIRIVWLWPEITIEELAERMKERAATGYVGATTDPKRAWELRGRYHPITLLPHMKLDTRRVSGLTPEESAKLSATEAIQYILGDQPHDNGLDQL